MKAQHCTKVHRIIETGLFYAELNELLTRELASDGYGGCEVKTTPSRTEIIIKASNTQFFVEKSGRRHAFGDDMFIKKDDYKQVSKKKKNLKN